MYFNMRVLSSVVYATSATRLELYAPRWRVQPT